jgi:hypothetical protein
MQLEKVESNSKKLFPIVYYYFPFFSLQHLDEICMTTNPHKTQYFPHKMDVNS